MKCLRRAAVIAAAGMILNLTACANDGSKEYKQAVEYFKQGEYESAKDLMAQAISASPDNSEYELGYALTLVELGAYDEAREHFLSLMKESDNKSVLKINKQAYRGIALSLYEEGNYDQAKGYFKLALDTKVLGSIDTDLMAYYANCEVFLGNYESAVKSFDKLIEKCLASKSLERAEYYIGRANSYMTLEKYDMALEDYKKAISIDDSCYAAYLGEYLTLMEMHDKDAAKGVLDKALTVNDNSEKADYYKAVFYFYKEEYDNAEALLQQAIQKGINEAIFYQGRIYQEKGDYENALNSYFAYLEKCESGKSAEVCNQIGGCYLAKDDYENAGKWFDEGIAIAGGSIKENLMYNRIAVYEKTGCFKKAKEMADMYLTEYKNTTMTREYEFIATRYRENEKK